MGSETTAVWGAGGEDSLEQHGSSGETERGCQAWGAVGGGGLTDQLGSRVGEEKNQGQLLVGGQRKWLERDAEKGKPG